MKQHHTSISGLAVTKDSTRVISCSADKTIRIYEIEKAGTCVYRISYSESLNKTNLQFKGLVIKDTTLIALGCNVKGPTYLIKYDLKDKDYKCTGSETVHLRASSSIGLSKDGS